MSELIEKLTKSMSSTNIITPETAFKTFKDSLLDEKGIIDYIEKIKYEIALRLNTNYSTPYEEKRIAINFRSSADNDALTRQKLLIVRKIIDKFEEEGWVITKPTKGNFSYAGTAFYIWIKFPERIIGETKQIYKQNFLEFDAGSEEKK